MTQPHDPIGPQPSRASSPDQRIVLRQLFDAFALGEHGKFVPLRPGVEILPLYGMAEDGVARSVTEPSAALLRYAPGASVPAHNHAGYEHIFVLQGSQRDDHGEYLRGTCVISPPGSHHAVTSEHGCLVLAIWNHSVEMLDT
jgi:anti-sigma factor ChrR (cupin superfamily)